LKKKINITGNLIIFVALLIVTTTLLSCADNKIGVTKVPDIQNLPTYTAKDFVTVYTDSAKLQVIMSAPLVERYT
jgi:hypothetical protein